jgi:DNA replication protein DnaC
MNKQEQFENYWKPQLMQIHLTPRIIDDLYKFPPDESKVKKLNESLIQQRSIYLYGKVNTGKTLFACACLIEYLRCFYIESTNKSVKFISFPELILELKDSFEKEDMNESAIIKKYSSYDLLVLDEFGLAKISDWLINVLYVLINSRYENMKSTIFTSNLSISDMIKKLNDTRIPRRINAMCDLNLEM